MATTTNGTAAPTPPQLLQVIEEASFEDFGFVVLRTGYGNDTQYETWSEEFGNVIEASVMASVGAETLIEKFMLTTIDDEGLKDASWSGVSKFFEEAREDNMVPPGLDVGFCIVVDQAAMESLLAPKEGEEPWVWAVDTDFDFDAASSGAADAYPGYFKVAVATVVTGFYAAIAGSEVEGAELWRSAQPVWKPSV